MNNIRVRFAPSPTGNLHIGSARTALFNWLFAKKNSGKFILRIEDTDKIRSTKEFEDNICDSLKWLGLNWDEGLYRQSERLEIYRKYADELLKNGFAYEEPDKSKGTAVKFKIPGGNVSFNDIIRGSIEFENSNFEDLVILKSDGTPTYNFAVVLDDALMEITHVIRGEDHISNTPKQILLYKAMGFKLPEFSHLPLIYGPDKKRLSKRQGPTSVTEYKEIGYLPEAIINFLALLGWAYDDKQVIFSVEELISKFSLEKVSKNPAIFDINKLNWLNGYYIRVADIDKITELCLPYFESSGFIKKGYSNRDYDYVKSIVYLEKEKIKTLSQVVDNVDFFFKDDIEYDKNALEKVFGNENSRNLLKEFLEEIKSLEGFSITEVEGITKVFVLKKGVKLSDIVHPVRVAITGKLVSPGIFDTMSMIGKDRCIARIQETFKLLQTDKI